MELKQVQHQMQSVIDYEHTNVNSHKQNEQINGE